MCCVNLKFIYFLDRIKDGIEILYTQYILFLLKSMLLLSEFLPQVTNNYVKCLLWKSLSVLLKLFLTTIYVF
jgi:hypothetical protein